MDSGSHSDEESSLGSFYQSPFETLMQTPDGFGHVLGELASQLRVLQDEAAQVYLTWRKHQQQWCSKLVPGAGSVERISQTPVAKQPFTKGLTHARNLLGLQGLQSAAATEKSDKWTGAQIPTSPPSEPKDPSECSEFSFMDKKGSNNWTFPIASEEKFRQPRSAALNRLGTNSALRKQTLSALFLMRGIWADLSNDEIYEYTQRFNQCFGIPSLRTSCIEMREELEKETSREDEEKRTSKHRFILHPSSWPRLSWNIFCLFLIAYDIIFIPLEAFNLEEHIIMFVIEWVCTVTWTLDVFVSLRTAFYKGPALVTDPWLIAANYAKTWFGMDLVIVFLEWASRVSNVVPDGSSLLRATRILRMLRCLRLLRLSKLQYLWANVEEQVTSSIMHLVVGVAKLAVLLCTMVHVIACLWYAIGIGTSDGWETYEFENIGLERQKNFIFWYIASCRWTLAQFNGRTDMDLRRNTIELFFACIVAIVVAIIFMALFVSSITTTMMELNHLAESKTLKRRLADKYLKKHRVGLELIGSIRHHITIDEYHSEEQDLQIKVLEMLPSSIAQDLLYEVKTPILLVHRWFNGINREHPRTLRHMCKTVIHQEYPGLHESMFERGDACTRMLFVFSGVAQYTTDYDPTENTYVNENQRDDPDEVTLGRGRWVSEPAVWMEWVNRGRLFVGVRCCFMTIEAPEFAKQLREYRSAYAFAVMYGRAFLKSLQQKGVLSDITEEMTQAALE